MTTTTTTTTKASTTKATTKAPTPAPVVPNPVPVPGPVNGGNPALGASNNGPASSAGTAGTGDGMASGDVVVTDAQLRVRGGRRGVGA